MSVSVYIKEDYVCDNTLEFPFANKNGLERTNIVLNGDEIFRL